MHVNINNVINNSSDYLAHIKPNKKDELLEEHMELTYEYYKKIIKGNENIVSNSFNKLHLREKNKEICISEKVKFMLIDMFENAIFLHDIGKTNLSFQKNKMGNERFRKIIATDNSNHSILSALIYFDIFYEKLSESKFTRQEKRVLNLHLVAFSYAISRHHGYLKNLKDFRVKLIDLINDINDKKVLVKDYIFIDRLLKRKEIIEESGTFYQYEKMVRKYIYNPISYYVGVRTLFSLIVAADFYSTSDYMNDKINDFNSISEINRYVKQFNSDEIIEKINKFKLEENVESLLSKNGDISDYKLNDIRKLIYIESEKKLKRNTEKRIFYLEAPTGSGKTLNSINLALNLVKNNEKLDRIFYVFPFNTLSNQTSNVLNGIFDRDDIAVINSITPIKSFELENEKDKGIDEEGMYLSKLFLHYPITLTSHINFFNYLFGVNREKCLPLCHIANSVIIIDEIQSYNITIWKEIITMLDIYSKSYNFKLIIMSATLPKLDVLSDTLVETVNLISNSEKYFEHKVFSKRVIYDYSLIDNNSSSFEDLIIIINELKKERENARILFEFISKKTARKFYDELIKQNYETDIYELTGDDNALYRGNLLTKLKEVDQEDNYVLKDVIVIATQVIEAGVDIDMEIGFKDCSYLDSEEQFIGRINRNNKFKGSRVCFFDFDDEKMIYKNDCRIEYSIKDEKFRKILENKKFEQYYKIILDDIKKKKSEANNNSFDYFMNIIENLDFYGIEKKMRLITDETYRIYIPYKIEKTSDNDEICGEEVWNAYIELVENFDIGYAKKQIELSKLNKHIDYFSFNIRYKLERYEYKYGFYYIDDGEQYIFNGKFLREEFEKETKIKYGDVVFL